MVCHFLFDWVSVNNITTFAYVALLPLAICQMQPTNQGLFHKCICPAYCIGQRKTRFIQVYVYNSHTSESHTISVMLSLAYTTCHSTCICPRIVHISSFQSENKLIWMKACWLRIVKLIIRHKVFPLNIYSAISPNGCTHRREQWSVFTWLVFFERDTSY